MKGLMRVYLSASYGRREEMERYAHTLYQHNIEVVSSWVFQPAEEVETRLRADGLENWPTACDMIARHNCEDVTRSDILVMFSDGPESTSFGGRHVEMGGAIFSGIPVLMSGPIENPFQLLAGKVHRVEGIDGVIDWIRENKDTI